MSQDDLESRYWEAVELLDDGDPEGALELAEALLEENPGDADLLQVKGEALRQLGDFEEAIETFRAIVRADPNDMDGRFYIVDTLIELGQLAEAEREMTTIIERAPDFAGGYALRALLADIAGRDAEADEDYQRAARLDDEMPVPLRLTHDDFSAVLEAAYADIPDQFRAAFKNVSVSVRDFPPLDVVRDTSSPINMYALGYFDGVPLPDRTIDDPRSAMPSFVYIYKRNLERTCDTREDLVEEVRITLLHELGHFLGLDEDDMERLGLD